MIIFDGIQFFTSNTAISIYIVIIAVLIIIIAGTTLVDINKKNKFRRQNKMETLEKEKSGKRHAFLN